MLLMDYHEAIQWVLEFADFERSGRFNERPDVAPMRALLSALGDPHLGRVTVHVSGSKGKGSICAMVESILRASGLKTGLYTSPHLFEYTERIRLNGRQVTRRKFALLADRVRAGVANMEERDGDRDLVTFDLLTAMGFLAFQDAAVEVQVLEVGLGGRVDSTNVFETKEVVVISPLSLEHTSILGGSIEEIASEKAGIITPGCSVVLAPQSHAGAAGVVRRFAEGMKARVIDVEAVYRYETIRRGVGGQVVKIEGGGRTLEGFLPLAGRFQSENAAAAVAAIDALRAQGLVVSDKRVVAGLTGVKWSGRVQVLHERPLVIADGAHNADSALRLVEALRDFGADSAAFVVGSLADKDIDAFAQVLAPFAHRVIAVRVDHPRAMEVKRVAGAFHALGVPTEDVDGIETAIDNAMAVTDEGGVICLTGSLFVAAEAVRHFDGRAVGK